MVIKLYISGISGNKEVKKKQQRVQMILDSKQITYEAIDITEPGKEKDKEFMQQNGKVRECLGKYPLPPQIFNDDDFCGDYEDFDLANEVDELEKFLHIATSPKIIENESKQFQESENNRVNSFDNSSYNPYEYHTYKIKWDNVNGQQEELIESTTEEISKVNDNDQIEEIKHSEVNGITEDVTFVKGNDSEIDPKTSNEDVLVPVKEEEGERKVENGIEESSEEATEADKGISSPIEGGEDKKENEEKVVEDENKENDDEEEKEENAQDKEETGHREAENRDEEEKEAVKEVSQTNESEEEIKEAEEDEKKRNNESEEDEKERNNESEEDEKKRDNESEEETKSKDESEKDKDESEEESED